MKGVPYKRILLGDKRKDVRLLEEELATMNARAKLIEEIATAVNRSGRHDIADDLLKLAQTLPEPNLAGVRKSLANIANIQKQFAKVDPSETFGGFAQRWISGELHKLYPDHVNLPSPEVVADNKYKLETYVFPRVKDVPLRLFTIDHAFEVMRGLPTMSQDSRRHIGQAMSRVLSLAVYPARIISLNPLPRGFLPKRGKRKARAFLFPDEEARLLACTEVPLALRLLFGLLTREGFRKEEARALEWSDLDLEKGWVNLDENKTDDPRDWPLSPGVPEALRMWKLTQAKGAKLVFPGQRRKEDRQLRPMNLAHLAKLLRDALELAKVERPALYENNENRKHIVAHDLRATFVTLSLAGGKSEGWVTRRTGHKSAEMVARYKRRAANMLEGAHVQLVPLVDAIPELRGLAEYGGRRTQAGSEAGGGNHAKHLENKG